MNAFIIYIFICISIGLSVQFHNKSTIIYIISTTNQNSNTKMSLQPQKLHELLAQKNLSPLVLFANKNTVSEIKNDFQDFVNYSKRHRNFIHQTFKLGLNTSQEQLQQNNTKQIVYSVNEILSCDQPALADLFFDSAPQGIKNSSEISQRIEEQQTDNIQSEAERLFDNDTVEENTYEIKQAPIQVKQYFMLQVQKYELIRLTLSILKQNQVNESCLGYIYKIWSFLIRNDSNPVLQFLEADSQSYELLMNNLHFYSVSNIIGQLLVGEDRSKQYRYEGLKKKILQRVISTLVQNKTDQQLYEGVSILLQEVFNNSKQTYYEYFEDFKRVVNYLSSAAVLDKFYNILMQKQERSFANALQYLYLIFQRINSQKQQGNYYREKDVPLEPSMNFQIQNLFSNFEELIKLIESSQSYNIITKINYIDLVYQMTQTTQIQTYWDKMPLSRILIILMKTYQSTNLSGIYKIKLSKLMETIIKQCSDDQLKTTIKQFPNFYSQFFRTLKSLNIDNTKSYNKSESIAFDCKLLFDLDQTTKNSIDAACLVHNKNVKRIKKRYQIKMASFGKGNKVASLQEEGSFFNFNENSNIFSKQGTDDSGLSNLVGKNQISIPVLHLNEQGKSNKPQSARISEPSERGKPKIQIQEVEVVQLEPIKFGGQVSLQPKQNTQSKEKSQKVEKISTNKALQKIEKVGPPKIQASQFFVRHFQLII